MKMPAKVEKVNFEDAIQDDKSEQRNHHFAGEAGTDELGHCAGDGFAEKSAS